MTAMRIGIDGHHLNGKPQGSRTYLLALLHELVRIAPEKEFFLYSFAPEATRALVSAPNLRHLRVFPESARLRLSVVVPSLQLRDRLSVFHSQYVCPPLSRVPEVVSLHDILFESHKELFEGAFSKTSVWLIRRSARRACRVLTVSEFCRREIVERYGLPEDRVLVTPDAVDPNRFRKVGDHELERVRKRYDLESPFVLSVGRLEPRKNLERLIRSFNDVRMKTDPGLQLVVAGKEDFGFETIYAEAARLPKGVVRFLGPVPDDDLPALYNLARVFAFPSFVEGFGMPILEAMACGTPVVSSAGGALAEIGGGAFLEVDPRDEDSIAGGLTRALTDGVLRESLRRAGLTRAGEFSWAETARRTLRAYEECATPL